jgi:F-type H+-transporting ATPase subunit delta
MEVSVDPALIGGAVTKIGDLVLDGSVKTQLKSLKESLQRSEVI